MDVEMKKRPKVGDRVEFRYRGVHSGEVVAVAVTGAHFLIKMPIGSTYRQRQVGINDIIQILPEDDEGLNQSPDQKVNEKLI